VIHPDIQYQLCRMEHEERVRRGLQHQEVSRALAEAREERHVSRSTSGLRRLAVAAFAGRRPRRGGLTRTETA